MQATHTQEPRVIDVDKNATYPKAIDELKAKEELPDQVELRQKKYLNNIASASPSRDKTISRFLAWDLRHSIRHGRSLKDTLRMNMIRKGQIKGVALMRGY